MKYGGQFWVDLMITWPSQLWRLVSTSKTRRRYLFTIKNLLQYTFWPYFLWGYFSYKTYFIRYFLTKNPIFSNTRTHDPEPNLTRIEPNHTWNQINSYNLFTGHFNPKYSDLKIVWPLPEPKPNYMMVRMFPGLDEIDPIRTWPVGCLTWTAEHQLGHIHPDAGQPKTRR